MQNAPVKNEDLNEEYSITDDLKDLNNKSRLLNISAETNAGGDEKPFASFLENWQEGG